MATVKQVLEQVDAMLPNQYTTAEKRRWLLQAEGFVVREVHQPHAGGEEVQVPPEDAVFIASDKEDLPVMELAGKSLAVADAADEVRYRAAKILWPSRDGGVGEYLYSLLK